MPLRSIVVFAIAEQMTVAPTPVMGLQQGAGRRDGCQGNGEVPMGGSKFSRCR